MKSSDNMLPMKSDMGGAAMVTGALALAISRGLNQRVKLILCAPRTWSPAMPSSWATSSLTRMGFRSKSRTPMRKVVWCWPMADGGLDSGAAYILDAATLTGAAKMALGRDYNAVFALDETEQQRALTAAKVENEQAWALPLEPGMPASSPRPLPIWATSPRQRHGRCHHSCCVLSRFVRDEGKGWVHLDLAALIRNRAMISGRPRQGTRSAYHRPLAAGGDRMNVWLSRELHRPSGGRGRCSLTVPTAWWSIW